MSKLVLVSHVLCPFVQRAAIILREKSVAFKRVDIDLSAKPDWFLAISPTAKVPLLRVQDDENETILFESAPICEYLDETQGSTRLHPGDPIARAQHRAWIDFGSSAQGEAWGYINAKDRDAAVVRVDALRTRFATLNNVLGDGPYFTGETFSIVDAVYAPLFRFFDALEGRVDEDRLFSGLDRVATWRAALRRRASVVAAVSEDYPNNLLQLLRRQGTLIGSLELQH